MKLIQNKLYLTLADCVESGLKERTITDAKDKGSKCWHIINDPDDLRRILVGYEDLKPEYRRMVDERFGNVYDQVARQPILEMVVNDAKAVAFFKGYRYGAGSGERRAGGERGAGSGERRAEMYLPIETVNKYVRAASWLNMLRDLNKHTIRKMLGLSVAEFFIHVGELIALEKGRGKMEGYQGLDVLPGDFPGTYQRLMARVSAYAKATADEGAEAAYESIIDARYGNKNAAKLGRVSAESGELRAGLLPSVDEVREAIYPVSGGKSDLKMQNKPGAFDPGLHERQVAVIRYCAALHNNLNAEQIRKMANTVFLKNGWKSVSVATIRNFIRDNKHVLTPGRRGKREYMSKVAMQNKRRAPGFPMVYWTLDGWTVELLYNQRGPKGMEYGKRLVVVVVLDAFNKYPIGYAIGERETPELIKDACRNAIMHTQELFGTPYHPLQLQSDNYQIKNLTPFYQAVKGRYFTPAAVGNSKAKVVEPYFNYLNDLCQAQFINWSGHNVDAAKENQVNTEVLDMIKSQFPDKEGVIKQIQDLMSQERGRKVQDYVAKWAELPAEDKMALGAEDYLMLFGEFLNGRTNRIEGQGIVKQVDGVEYTYDSFDPMFRQNLQVDWQIIGDKEDLRQVLAVSPDGKMRFLLEQKRELPMDLYSTTQEDVDYRVRVKDYNAERMQEVTDQYAADAETMREVLSNTPGMLTEEDATALKLMLTVKGQQKERLQDAKRLEKARKTNERLIAAEVKEEELDWEAKRMQWLNEG
jgi:hypothetical protein